MKKLPTIDWIPGIESETGSESHSMSILFSLLVSTGLFLLLPLSEFVRDEQWIVREVESVPFQSPPPPKTKLEENVEELLKKESVPQPLQTESVPLEIEALSSTLEVGPGDFKAEFSLNDYTPSANGFQGDLVFALHELDRTPNILKRGVPLYPPHLKKRGLEGEVKLLVQIDEKGTVRVLEIVSSTHPGFDESATKAAEGSSYEAPRRNGEPVKVQFYLPVRYSIFDQ